MLFLKRFNLVFPKSNKGLLLSGYRIVIDGLNIEARGDNIKEFFFTDDGAYCSWFLDMLPTIDSVNLKYYEQTLPSIFLFIAFIIFGTFGIFGCLKLYSLSRVILSSIAARCFILASNPLSNVECLVFLESLIGV